MQSPRVDRDANLLALGRLRASAEAANHDRAAPLLLRRRTRGVLVGAGVLLQLAHLVGDGRGRVDREMGHDLGSESLRQLDLALERLPAIRLELSVLEVLGPDAE